MKNTCKNNKALLKVEKKKLFLFSLIFTLKTITNKYEKFITELYWSLGTFDDYIINFFFEKTEFFFSRNLFKDIENYYFFFSRVS